MKMIALLGVVLLFAITQVRAEDYAAGSLNADYLHGTVLIGSETFRITYQGAPLHMVKTNEAEPLVRIAKLKFEQASELKLPVKISSAKNTDSDGIKLLNSIRVPYEKESGEVKYDKDLHLEAYRIRIRNHRTLMGTSEKKIEILIDHEEFLVTTICTKDKSEVVRIKFDEMKKVLKDANILGRRVKIDTEALLRSTGCFEMNSHPFSISEFVE